MYQLMIMQPGSRACEPMRHRNGTLRLLRTGKAAKKFASIVGKGTGRKIQPRPFASFDWRAREDARFADGTYQSLPWLCETWWANAPVANHYAHVSSKYPGRIAYTESDDKGLADIQTPMKAGRYLKKFCGLDDATVARWSVEFSRQFETGLLQFAESKEEVVDVYLRGPSSCMYHAASNYGSRPHHPVVVYASGDCAVAYMEREGRVTARTVVCKSTLQFARIYGDYERLNPLLKEAGYRQGNMVGAKLLRIPHLGGFVMPYLDVGLPVRDMGDHFKISTPSLGDYDTSSTSGMTGNWSDNRRRCENCEEAYAADGDDYCPQCREDMDEVDEANVLAEDDEAPLPMVREGCGCADCRRGRGEA
ncbi:MAG TPA: hypothetical protein VN325_23165 [Steroidobacteraceae bacterium]|nr:hypothetical protein [Steroidobacteraceae bacterium]